MSEAIYRAIGVISDIHGDIQALQTSLKILEDVGAEEIYVLGDIVGYGHQPNECCELIREKRYPVVAGNHDRVVAELKENHGIEYSDYASWSIDRTIQEVTEENWNWLSSLPLYLKIDDMEFVHSTLADTEKWYYLHLGKHQDEDIWQDVRKSFDVMKSNICFTGHSHIPEIFIELDSKRIKRIQPKLQEYELDNKRAVVNVGSISQPRTSSKKRSLVVYDTKYQILKFKRWR